MAGTTGDVGAIVAVEQLFASALAEICPAATGLMTLTGTVKRNDGSKAPEFVCTVATKVFWVLHRQAAAASAAAASSAVLPAAEKASRGGKEMVVCITSRPVSSSSFTENLLEGTDCFVLH